jgi:hypothetical protein
MILYLNLYANLDWIQEDNQIRERGSAGLIVSLADQNCTLNNYMVIIIDYCIINFYNIYIIMIVKRYGTV